MKDKNGTVITDPKVLEAEMVEQWKKIFTTGNFQQKEAHIAKNQPIVEEVGDILDNFTDAEILKACKGLKVSKSAGMSDIPTGILKYASFGVREMIRGWMQQMWDQECTPDEIG